MADFELAEMNVARLRAPIDDPIVAEFVDALEVINALAEASPGFVWRFQTADGNATSVHPYDDERVIVNVSTWTGIDALDNYVYHCEHGGFLRRRREWFERMVELSVALWWVPAGHQPDLMEAVGRLEHLRVHGASSHAFTFRLIHPPEPAADDVLSAP